MPCRPLVELLGTSMLEKNLRGGEKFEPEGLRGTQPLAPNVRVNRAKRPRISVLVDEDVVCPSEARREGQHTVLVAPAADCFLPLDGTD